MRVVFEPAALEQYRSWATAVPATAALRTLTRINLLITDCCRSVSDGVGKPERLRGRYAGAWSRRIDAEHRLLYTVARDRLVILGCRGNTS